MNAFTPGPWTISKCQCGDAVCKQHTISIQGSVGFWFDDATLIAAAPDMARALEAAKVALAMVIDRYDLQRDDHATVIAARDEAAAVLVNAVGEG